MSREDRKFIQFVVVAFILVFGIMVVGALLVDPGKPDPTQKFIEGPSVECKPYNDGVVCISATSVTR